VVSPTLDKSHGTERRVVEWISQLAGQFEIHVYSQRVRDLDPSKFTLHRIPQLPGPHLANFLWWFVANWLWRWWDRHFRGLRHDLVFSPGPNCLDADVISVHIVFAEYAQQLDAAPDEANSARPSWPVALHRKLYYRLAIFLEGRAYTSPRIELVFIARRTCATVKKYYGRNDPCHVVHVGLDHEVFNPARRTAQRKSARKELGLAANRFGVLLIGNDWRNKGLPVLLDALAKLRDMPIDLLVVGNDDPGQYRSAISAASLDGRVRFLPLRRDVELYYAAADAYAGPSVEDTFAQPPAEAMACGLPVIVSSENGTSEIITNGVDGLILEDPKDAVGLAAMIRRLYEDADFRESLGARAAEKTRAYTWENNGRELTGIFEEVLRRKARAAGEEPAAVS
jgi:glycosyltransferase involved in cell wall biosynthesis